MKGGTFTKTDSFTLSPLLAVLPRQGEAKELQRLSASLFARFEKVRILERSLDPLVDQGASGRITAEVGMLRQVLDWLSVRVDENDIA